jgi:hypothetical protein
LLILLIQDEIYIWLRRKFSLVIICYTTLTGDYNVFYLLSFINSYSWLWTFYVVNTAFGSKGYKFVHASLPNTEKLFHTVYTGRNRIQMRSRENDVDFDYLSFVGTVCSFKHNILVGLEHIWPFIRLNLLSRYLAFLWIDGFARQNPFRIRSQIVHRILQS